MKSHSPPLDQHTEGEGNGWKGEAAYLAEGDHGGGGEGEGEQQEHHHGGWAMVFYLVALAYLVPALLFFKLATTRQLFA